MAKDKEIDKIHFKAILEKVEGTSSDKVQEYLFSLSKMIYLYLLLVECVLPQYRTKAYLV